jgi:cytochrome c553
MNSERVFSWRNSWFSASVGATAAVVVLSLIAGFILLPYATTNAKFASLWDAICSAAGVPRVTANSETVKPTAKMSDVVLATQLAGPVDARAVGRGATLAMQCAICHASNRQSQVDTPNLEGQSTASEKDILDIAAYYAFMPRQPGLHPDLDVPAPSIVKRGAAMRNVPACASCHGGADVKAGSPWLEGQSAVYITSQLQAFAAGTRRNDISEQMRNIARQMTPQEVDDAARYYASRR